MTIPRNRSGGWCSMAVCRNLTKTTSYPRRWSEATLAKILLNTGTGNYGRWWNPVAVSPLHNCRISSPKNLSHLSVRGTDTLVQRPEP